MKQNVGIRFCLLLLCAIGVAIGGINSSALAELSAEDSFLYPEYSKTISMDFKDASLTDVLKIFSQQSGLNFIAADEISDKTITLFLDKVPVEVALDKILTANSLTYQTQPGSNIFVVKYSPRPAKELMTRIYNLKHASVVSSKINTTISIDTEGGGASSGSSSSGSSPAAAMSGGSEQGSGGDSSTGLVAALKTVLTPDGSIVEDPRTNSIIITDIPRQFPLIEQTIAALDVPIPQILIEVEMLDISKDAASQIGVKIGDTPVTFSGGERDHLYPWDQNMLLDKGFSFGEEYRVGTISAAGLTATLQFLKTRTDTKNLARPRILTLNNETAQIQISTDEAIGVSTQVDASSGGLSTSSTEAERVKTGVFLTVTPQANLTTKDITMAIAPKVIQARSGGTFDGQTFKDPEERGSKSVLRVQDGDTIILGGLLRTDYSDTQTKVPLFGDIPVVGAAFRHNDKDNTERELVIFITPHIVDESIKPKLAFTGSREIVREQDIIPIRRQEIDKELKRIESQR